MEHLIGWNRRLTQSIYFYPNPSYLCPFGITLYMLNIIWKIYTGQRANC